MDQMDEQISQAIAASIQTKLFEDEYNKQKIVTECYEYNPLPLILHPLYEINNYEKLENSNQMLLPSSICENIYQFNQLNSDGTQSTQFVDDSLLIFKVYKTQKKSDELMKTISDTASEHFTKSMNYCIMTMYDISGDDNIYIPTHLYQELGLAEEPNVNIKFKYANINNDTDNPNDTVQIGTKMALKPLNLEEFSEITDYKTFLEVGILGSYKTISLNDKIIIGNNEFLVRKTEPSNIIKLIDADVEIEFVDIENLPTKKQGKSQLNEDESSNKDDFTSEIDRIFGGDNLIEKKKTLTKKVDVEQSKSLETSESFKPFSGKGHKLIDENSSRNQSNMHLARLKRFGGLN